MIIEHRHTLPKRWDKCHSMCVKHLRRKLRGHHDRTLPVHGIVHVYGDRLLWVRQASNPSTVGTLLDDLKPHEGHRAVKLDLTVVVDLDKRAAEVRAHNAARGKKT